MESFDRNMLKNREIMLKKYNILGISWAVHKSPYLQLVIT